MIMIKTLWKSPFYTNDIQILGIAGYKVFFVSLNAVSGFKTASLK